MTVATPSSQRSGSFLPDGCRVIDHGFFEQRIATVQWAQSRDLVEDVDCLVGVGAGAIEQLDLQVAGRVAVGHDLDQLRARDLHQRLGMQRGDHAGQGIAGHTGAAMLVATADVAPDGGDPALAVFTHGREGRATLVELVVGQQADGLGPRRGCTRRAWL